jgi:lipoate-protein ligase A
MIYICLPDNNTRDLSFYLAMEEYVARHKDGDDFFFMWQVQPSVIFGRNQLIENEVNLDFCRKHGIKTYRRKSGGGCVYADMSNVMFSYITKDENVNFTFNRYINMVVLVLRKLGIEATASGRNDIMIDGRKVSGNAFYHIPGRSIVHGTMLYDTNMTNMVGSITPTDEKLLSKGVSSVRQHIALLKDYTSISLEEFKTFVKENLCDKAMTLNADDISIIKEIEKEYISDEFVYGSNPKYTVIHKRRIDGVGDFEARIELKNDIIKEINLMGDFFLVGDMDNRILKRLRGVKMEREAIINALPEKMDDIILHLDREMLADIVINK